MVRVIAPQSAAAGITRRQVLGRLTAVLAGIGAAGCAPLRIVLKDYPDEFITDAALVERTLRAFALTVVPGAPPDDPALTRVFADPFHPLAPHRGFLASDLSWRAYERFGDAGFASLPLDRRTWVVRRGLGQPGLTGRMYAGAVLLAQVAAYAGIYDDTAGSPLIGFPGRGHVPSRAELTYPDAARFLARPLSHSGNPS
jgi:hypothetical protein